VTGLPSWRCTQPERVRSDRSRRAAATVGGSSAADGLPLARGRLAWLRGALVVAAALFGVLGARPVAVPGVSSGTSARHGDEFRQRWLQSFSLRPIQTLLGSCCLIQRAAPAAAPNDRPAPVPSVHRAAW